MLITLETHTLFDDPLGRDSVVVDLGANRGLFARAVVQRFGCRCLAVETVPELSTAIPALPGLTVVNAAIAGFDGAIDLNISSHPEASTIMANPGAGRVLRTCRVPALRLASLLAAHGIDRIDLLKVDIEGAEVELFQSMDDSSLAKIGQISCEFHDEFGMISPEQVDQIDQRLKKAGFDRIQFYRTNRLDMLYVNKRRRGLSRFKVIWGKYITRNHMGWKRWRQRRIDARNR